MKAVLLLFFFAVSASIAPLGAEEPAPAINQVESAATATVDTAVRAAIDAGNAEYIRAMAAADTDAFVQVYDPDAARLHRDGQFTRGHQAIRAEVAAMFAEAGPIEVTIVTDALWVVDSSAYESGRWTYAYTPPGEERRNLAGRYVTIWKRQPDGGWKIATDMSVPKD